MKTYNHTFIDNQNLKKWVTKHNFINFESTLIQVFCGIANEETLKSLSTFLLEVLPHASLISTTTDGEIKNKDVLHKKIVISITTFENTQLTVASSSYNSSSKEMGRDLASQADSKEIKVAIIFTTGININGENFLNGFQEIINKNCTVVGGMAGDNGLLEQTFVGTNDKIYARGAVAVFLKSDKLKVFSHYHSGWNAIGIPMKITKAVKNRIYEIDNQPTRDIYAKYFGQNVANQLPRIGIELPLMLNRNGIDMGRACLRLHNDGSLSFAGNIIEGEEVRFGVANIDSIISDSNNFIREIQNEIIPESIFVYSCMARRRLLNRRSNIEIQQLAEFSKIAGFFTYGEFYTDKKKYKLFNETMTIVALSENKDNTCHLPIDNEKDKLEHRSNTVLVAITNMLNVMAQEWDEKLDDEVKKNLEHQHTIIQQNKLAQMGEMIAMIAHQWRQPLNALSATAINLSLRSQMKLLDDKDIEDGSQFIQQQCQKMSKTIDTFLDFAKPSQGGKSFKIIHSVDAVLQIMEGQLLNHNIDVNIIDNNKDAEVYGEENQLEQVLLNLISNARDAFDTISTKKKYINIFIEKKLDLSFISIEDNAGGIDERVVQKIFNPYFTTKEEGKGTGLGLYMSLDIIKNNFCGDLAYKSIPDGSRFEITFNKSRDCKKDSN